MPLMFVMLFVSIALGAVSHYLWPSLPFAGILGVVMLAAGVGFIGRWWNPTKDYPAAADDDLSMRASQSGALDAGDPLSELASIVRDNRGSVDL